MSRLTFWLTVGFLGQALFTARFVVQWLVSERKRDSVVPVAFWWLSLLGGMALLCYAISRRDPVIIVGQAMGLCVYLRNLMLVHKAKQRSAQLAALSSHRIEDHYAQGTLRAFLRFCRRIFKLTPMGIQGGFFECLRIALGSSSRRLKTALSDLLRRFGHGFPGPPVPLDRRSLSPRSLARHLETTVGRRAIVRWPLSRWTV